MTGRTAPEPLLAPSPPVAPVPRGAPATAVDVLLDVVSRRGCATAVADTRTRASWDELLERSAVVALHLAEQLDDAPADAPVAVLASSGVEAVVGAVGVLLSGHPLVLLDAALPAGRLAAVQAVAGAVACLVDDAHRDVAAEGLDCRLLHLAQVRPGEGEEPGAAVLRWSSRRPAATLAPSSAASVVLTSGSTGAPKGVVLSHALVVDGASSAAELLGVVDGAPVGLLAPPAFAMGQTVLWTALLHGAELHALDPREVGLPRTTELLRERAVEITWVTPSLLRSLAAAVDDGGLPRLATVACGGEALHGDDVRSARERLGARTTVVNVLGSSETWHTAAEVVGPEDEVPDGLVPPGRALPGTVLEVVDDDGRVLPDGSTGVLRVRAAVLADGYLGLDSGAFSTTDGGWATFLTSDLARKGPDGRVEIRGRADDAVKVGGYLVEPLEVEQALRRHPGVDEAVVTAREDGRRRRLVAHAAVGRAVRPPSPADLRRSLLRDLPGWMVPEDVVLLAELPRTERGKVDRAALPLPARPPHEPPRGDLEQRVARVWTAVLGRADVGRHDSLTSLGGDSLTVEELIARLHDELGVQLTPSHVAEARTVAALSAVVGSSAAPDRRAPLAEHSSVAVLQAGSGQDQVHCFAGAGSGGHTFMALAAELGPDVGVCAYQHHGLHERAAADLTVAMAARRHVRRLVEVQPHGPYHLLGHSMGGLVALEAARRLEAAGERVASVTLVDTYLPGNGRRILKGLLTSPGSRRRARSAAPPRVGPATRGDGPPPCALERLAGALVAALGLGTARSRERVQQDLAVCVTALHRPRRWEGPVLFVRSPGNPDRSTSWDGLLTGPVRSETVPAEHDDLLRSPHVTRVAELVRAELARSSARV